MTYFKTCKTLIFGEKIFPDLDKLVASFVGVIITIIVLIIGLIIAIVGGIWWW